MDLVNLTPVIELQPDSCPVCQAAVESITAAPTKVQQVAELVEQPVEIREYRRPLCQCTDCGWSGYSQLLGGVLEGFSYGGRLCSVVGWLGYGGNVPWRKQEYFVEHVLGVPISQGSKRQDAALLQALDLSANAKCLL